jgi:TrmH family RNA methyltransferase
MRPNPLHIAKLRTREGRLRSGCVIVEGVPEARQALAAGLAFEEIYICPEIFNDPDGEFSHLSPVPLTLAQFASIAFGTHLKGLLAVCRPKPVRLEDLSLGDDALVVVLEAVEKPGNLGAVLRSCDGAGVQALIHCDGKTDLYNQHVVRSSMGTVFALPAVTAGREDTYAFLKNNGFRLLAACPRSERMYYEGDFSGRCAILIGSEHEGLSKFWLNACDESITIPMKGQGKCLNAAMSASILIYEALRQREPKSIIS